MRVTMSPLSPAASRWQKLLHDHARSDLSLRAFAASRGVNAHTLAWWKSRLAAASTPAFLPVHVVPTPAQEPGCVEIALVNGCLVRVRGHVDEVALSAILRAAGRTS